MLIARRLGRLSPVRTKRKRRFDGMMTTTSGFFAPQGRKPAQNSGAISKVFKAQAGQKKLPSAQ